MLIYLLNSKPELINLLIKDNRNNHNNGLNDIYYENGLMLNEDE